MPTTTVSPDVVQALAEFEAAVAARIAWVAAFQRGTAGAQVYDGLNVRYAEARANLLELVGTMTTKGNKRQHTWKQCDGDIDVFAYEDGEYHNGPVCERCGFSFCHHCNPEGYQTECGESKPIPASDANLSAGLLSLIESIRLGNIRSKLGAG